MNETQLKQKIVQKLETLGHERLAFLESVIDSLDVYRRSQRVDAEGKIADEGERQAFARSLRGRYAHVATSSDEFARKKQAEIDWEDRYQRFQIVEF